MGKDETPGWSVEEVVLVQIVKEDQEVEQGKLRLARCPNGHLQRIVTNFRDVLESTVDVPCRQCNRDWSLELADGGS